MPRTKPDETPTAETETPAKKKRPRVSVLERRLQNPFGEPSTDIPLKDPTMVPRWFNTARPGQIARAKSLGWEAVTMDMVADMDRIGDYVLGVDNAICRGERQQERLMYMPRADRDAIQRAKTEENNRRMSNPNAQRRDALEAYGKMDERGANYALHADIRTTHERIERTGELED